MSNELTRAQKGTSKRMGGATTGDVVKLIGDIDLHSTAGEYRVKEIKPNGNAIVTKIDTGEDHEWTRVDVKFRPVTIEIA